MARIDPHSYTDDSQPFTTRAELSLRFDFERKLIEGEVTLHLANAAPGRLDLDTRTLEIFDARDPSGELRFEQSAPEPILGARLTVFTQADQLTLRFRTSPEASALQWLAPEQTDGKAQPYVFTQCQAIHARSIFPCQDTPRARITYEASLDLPAPLHAVMAAAHLGREENGERVVERFEMKQPIPTYLFALAVGDIAGQDIGPRSRVYAEPSVLAQAAWEFDGVEQMISAAEGLFGPYDWERFDLLVLPASFPYGGMENPRMTFLTPTLLAKDRSLVNVLAHELAHSWTGNLVTNATVEDFWLNEGFTVYAERRILEVLEGDASVALHAAIGLSGLEDEVKRFGADSPMTCLRTHLEGVDPDQVYSQVPYEKGYFFLRRIEDEVGRPAFDRFLKSYISTFRFQSISTETFLDFLASELPEARAVDVARWVDQPGIPDDLPRPVSETMASLKSLAARFSDGVRPNEADVSGWNAQAWQIYLDALPRRCSPEACAELDQRFALSSSSNAEIRIAFLTICAYSEYAPCFQAIEEALESIGRMKYLRPLYTALIAGGPDTKAFAKRVFGRAKSGYHPVAAAVIGRLLS